MRVVIQRCKHAEVTVEGEVVGRIGEGLMVLVGVTHEDDEKDVKYIADKVAGLRIFEDEEGKMNFSVQDVGGAVLSVSQFTLYGDTRKGKRPNFMAAAKPDAAKALYEAFNQELAAKGLTVETGKFGAMMDVSLTNWGPVTIIIDSRAS
ncbi:MULTISPECIES: D-aminoacyl-tRNA deacylase [Paenibacillus]|jgi:D-tyrosyl-tRNA(Tyr) deacylase|uniref:D-aminoacyl-tRNA deacylase n=2 Tax=Paenibacillus lactis TaxID=228574 RepID=G4HPX0_9BACL|nr:MULTISPECIES: D-aminoacyl-tRNA deacylase [Paenibacillus]EHB46517.1 D-tyrosyl-tRNA(Tyr) deacylase [Paenibacillus lactis 154]MBP1896914.1 D-tyrosyl-tRNA(Tyr) deacylase [Paenibacillus lactis]MCM3497609.1 D-aminoacyl-tRNA deacylase [Paenibacillus lactis]GIO90790.1 D-aminoacyl-tRNA deacylase [Paenibacillus lactis]HAG00931.1 D-tyrosyl-tRNA(Tyr) deacylase [Paenibacillus lactis]